MDVLGLTAEDPETGHRVLCRLAARSVLE